MRPFTFKTLAALALSTLAFPSMAALQILACEPEWGALAKELGGDKVSVYVATNALQDPHRIQAKPSLLAKARTANLLVCTGAELEGGWLPVLQQQSGNAAIQQGRPGSFEAAAFVPLLEVPARVDRSMGDIHAGGNPHIQTDPRNIGRVAVALASRLAELDPANKDQYANNHQAFATRWNTAIANWEKLAAPLKGMPVVVHHRSFAYLEHWLGIRSVAQIEPKPGVEPTTAHLSDVLARLQQTPAKAVLRAAYNDGRGADWLAQRAHIPVVVLPFTVGASERSNDLFSLYDDTIRLLLAMLQGGGS